ncbi:MAG: hypothetical protein C0459_08315 [Chitinophaga sp.]|jgi:GLPGLI family protein|nr:hypothetical protein [Chitinophaga sp.]
MKTVLFVIISFITISVKAQQRTVAECTVTFELSTDSTKNKQLYNALKNTTKVLYIKGNLSRTDLIARNYLQTIFINKDTSDIVVLRHIGENKLITNLSRKKWLALNNLYDSVVFTPSNETKKITGYDCKKLTCTLKNGDSYSLFYATAITPSIKDYEYLFRKVPGLVLEYEIKQPNGNTVKYTASKINLSPVPSSKMEIPAIGYRLVEE